MIRSLLLMMAMLGLAAAAPVRAAGPDHYLFSGDQAAKGKDFLAVNDGGPASPGSGRLLTSAATDQISVRSHHTEYEMPASGMLFANDHDANRSFIFDLRDPLHSRVETSFTDLAGFAMPHRFLRLPNGHVLASFQQARSGVAIAGMPEMMGYAKSDGLVEIDDAGKFVRAVANADPAHPGMLVLPYSLTVLPAIDRVLVTNSPMQDDYLLQSVTFQLFRLSDLKLFGTWPLDPGPSLSGHIGPQEARLGPDGAVYVQTLSCGLQRVTGMDMAKPAAVLVHQFPGFSCGVPTIAGHYLVQSVEGIGGFIVLDIANGAKPVEVSWLVINPGFHSHWTAWDRATNRVIVTSGKAGDRMYLLMLASKTGSPTINQTFRDIDGKPGFSFAKRA